MFKKLTLLLLSLSLFLVSCGQPKELEDNGNDSEETKEETTQPKQKDTSEDEINTELTPLAENLETPWSIEKNEHTFYISERVGKITKVEDDETIQQNIDLSMKLSDAEEAGLLGFILDPQFNQNNEAFAYYTYVNHNEAYNRVVKLSLEDNVWLENEVLLDEIPDGDFHHGGRIKIGPDDKLYITTGDATQPSLSQEMDSLGGKILRMNLDGSIPEDNPISDSYIYSYGHRNAQGLTWLDDGEMYASEHGNQANDEINLIEAGKNYGWPLIEGEEEGENLISPLFTSGSEKTWAPSGMDFYEDKLYVAGLRGNAIYEFDLKTKEVEEYMTDFGRIRDILIEDNFLYFITNNTDGRGEPKDTDDYLYRIGLSELK